MKLPVSRHRLLFAALLGTLVLSALSSQNTTPRQELEGVQPATPAATSVPGRQAEPDMPRVELDRLRQGHEDTTGADTLFGAKSWYVPPPPPPPRPPPKPLPPPPPSAPPLPFSFLGRYVDGETLTILLVKGERMYTVSVGDVIENTYRVESLRGNVLELTYLPLNLKQTINTG